MNKKCCNCKNLLKSQSVTINNNRLVIKLPTQRVCNNQKFCFVVVQAIPVSATPLPVVIEVGDVGYNYLNHNDNFVYSDQLKTQRLYMANAKTDTTIFKNIMCNLLQTNVIIECNEVPTPTPTV